MIRKRKDGSDMEKGMTYKGVGVDYDAMDPFKRMAQIAGLETSGNIKRFGFSEVGKSRGESCYLIETPDFYLAHVEEGLGTKNDVADKMYFLTGKSHYDQIAQCTVAMIVNDIITLGALPISVAMHLAVGRSEWFKDEKRSQDLIEGWKMACNLARCVWAGGETPTLKGIVNTEVPVLSGSALGIVKPKSNLLMGEKIQDGDQILFFESSGIHANGLTLAGEIETRLKYGYEEKINSVETFGEWLLKPTHIYVGIIEDLINAGVDIHYAVNITGHGWRKLMRANEPFAYVIKRLPRQLPIFSFIQEYGPMSDEEAYGNLNMGAGFAIYVPHKDLAKIWKVFDLNRTYNFLPVHAGHIEKSKDKKVIIEPKGITFEGSTLEVR